MPKKLGISQITNIGATAGIPDEVMREIVKPPGRPAGSPNREYDVVEAVPTQCKKCTSTNRTKYEGNPTVLREPGEGETVVTTWKRCQCTNCGQWRQDKFVHREPC